jgi:hypothetical protein
MGLTLTVGRPRDVFTSVYAPKVGAILEREYPGALGSAAAKTKPWRTDEMPWSGWAELQAKVKKAIGRQKPFHFGSVEAWCGVFLPLKIEPAELKLFRGDPLLQVASTLELNRELREYARRVRLPTANSQLAARYEKCLDDDEEMTTNFHMLAYLQLMQAVNQSLSRKQPLWVVK